MTDKNKFLKIMAMQKGLCKEWSDAWHDNSTDKDLLEKYIKGLDFCIKNDYPSNKFIRENFDSQWLQQNGVFVDVDGFVTGGKSGTYVVQGDSYGNFHFSKHDAATIWVRHNSEISIEASGNAFVVVHCYDTSNVRIEVAGTAKVSVHKHSTSCIITEM